jgi:hypothetical protein
MRILSLLILVLSLAPTTLAGQRPPKGWRFPIESDYVGEWKDFRERLPVPFHVKADFTGDKIADDAWILIRSDNKGWGLFVFLGRRSGKAKIVQLDNHPEDSSPQKMGIALARPGDHKTACGKGYYECKRSEPEMLRLKNPGIEYFYHEVSSSIFYWSKSANRFKQVLISD